MLAGMQAQRRQQPPGLAGCVVLLCIKGLVLSGAELLGVTGACPGSPDMAGLQRV